MNDTIDNFFKITSDKRLNPQDKLQIADWLSMRSKNLKYTGSQTLNEAIGAGQGDNEKISHFADTLKKLDAYDTIAKQLQKDNIMYKGSNRYREQNSKLNEKELALNKKCIEAEVKADGKSPDKMQDISAIDQRISDLQLAKKIQEDATNLSRLDDKELTRSLELSSPYTESRKPFEPPPLFNEPALKQQISNENSTRVKKLLDEKGVPEDTALGKALEKNGIGNFIKPSTDIFGKQENNYRVKNFLSKDYQYFDTDGNKIKHKYDYDTMAPAHDPDKKWSEGLNRNIDTIMLSHVGSSDHKKIMQELEKIGAEVGFDVKKAPHRSIWMEDPSIRRHDGKVYLPDQSISTDYKSLQQHIAESRKNISSTHQGQVAKQRIEGEYINTIDDGDQVFGKSYLEGGNVLNTLMADGTPAAVIGAESISYTMNAMKLENTPKNEEIAKKQIAEDLGLSPEKVSYIPQLDFHIDMFYRPLQDGKMAVPDYDAARGAVADILKNSKLAKDKRNEYKNLLNGIEEMSKLSKPITEKAEAALKESGYDIVKIPCFTVLPNAGGKGSDELENPIGVPLVNFMNGVCGTAKNGSSYYITNKSNLPELNSHIEKCFKKAGVNKVFFVSTGELLKLHGGLDCITQEK